MGCVPSSADGLAASHSAAPIASAHAASATPFSPKAFELHFPAEIAPGTGPQCGFPGDRKLAARLDPVVETSPGVWTFYGCIASAGNIFYNVNLTLDFPDSQTFAFPVLDTTDRAAEAHFTVEVRRASVIGAIATIYCDQSRR